MTDQQPRYQAAETVVDAAKRVLCNEPARVVWHRAKAEGIEIHLCSKPAGALTCANGRMCVNQVIMLEHETCSTCGDSMYLHRGETDLKCMICGTAAVVKSAGKR